MAEVKKLLMIDDDKDLLAMLKLKLEKTGNYNVVTSTDGSKAVELACDTAPDLIVLDIDMPDMDGGAVANSLSESEDTRNIPILFLSSLVPKEQVAESGGIVGGRNMASKKGGVQELIDRIDSMIK